MHRSQTTLLRVDAGIRVVGSSSRAIADIVQESWAATVSGSAVVHRDVGLDPVPATYFSAGVEGALLPDTARTEEQRLALKLAAELVDELDAADALLFTVPLYNFGVSQHFKSYIDLVITDPRVGPRPTSLRGKPAELVVARGGHYVAGTPREGWDHALPWMRRILSDVWGLDLSITEIDLTKAGTDPSIDELAGAAAQLRVEAERTARDHGLLLAQRGKSYRAA
jgi:FMN-dependent NADH-azoreductase